MNFDRLDQVADLVRVGDIDAVGGLSTGERLYVALAANSHSMLHDMQYNIVEALARLGDDDVRELVLRWRYRG